MKKGKHRHINFPDFHFFNLNIESLILFAK